MAVLDTEILVNYYFEEICKIPHGSYNEEKIADFVEAFAKEKGFRYHRDHLNNIVIYKEASLGYENHETLMLKHIWIWSMKRIKIVIMILNMIH